MDLKLLLQDFLRKWRPVGPKPAQLGAVFLGGDKKYGWMVKKCGVHQLRLLAGS